MATRKPVNPLGSVRGHVGEARGRFEADRKQREAAGRAANSVILSPGDIKGEYDANRLLETALGGKRRYITASDLAAFRRNMKAAQGRVKRAGVTARQVIDLAASHPLNHVNAPHGDLERARKQVSTASPVSSLPTPDKQALDVRFVTAGASGRRHHCVIRFLGFSEQVRRLASVPADPALARAEKAPTIRQAAQAMRAGYLKIECDCGRWRYWFRYIATIGGFNAGRDESGFPKIRNPELSGIACKHILRTLREVESSALVLGFLERALQKEGRHTIRQAELNKAAARRPAAILTSEERAAKARAERERRAIIKAASQPRPPINDRRMTPAHMKRLASIAKALGMAPEEAMRRLIN